MQLEKKICLNCEKTIQGRADKKFCDDICRSNHHNMLYRESSVFHKPITRILVKNRKILEKMQVKRIRYTDKTYMINAGFHFDFITHMHVNESGTQYRFCFEFGYYIDSKGRIYILHRPPKLW